MIEGRVLVGLIGANIMRSLSPALHAEAFAAAGIDGYYHLMDVNGLPGRSLDNLFAAVKAAGFAGVNVTIPFKQDVLSLIDTVDDEVADIRAVNAVSIARDGGTRGYNTDRRGFRRSFEEGLGRASSEAAIVVLLGAGGAGRAVAFALMDLGVAAVIVHDSDASRAARLHAALTSHYGSSRCRLTGNLERDIVAADGIVNATPIGMSGFPGSPVPSAFLRAGHWVADVIYTPIETVFIKAAAAKGARTLTGGGMCVHQAAETFRLFTGVAPDIARLHRAFSSALARRDTTEETR
jgi:shikimate dehydrogenase